MSLLMAKNNDLYLEVHHSSFSEYHEISGILLPKREDPMRRIYLVTLTDAERTALQDLTKKGKVTARKLTRAHILLQANAGVTPAEAQLIINKLDFRYTSKHE
jgi:hypothetical protein